MFGGQIILPKKVLFTTIFLGKSFSAFPLSNHQNMRMDYLLVGRSREWRAACECFFGPGSWLWRNCLYEMSRKRVHWQIGTNSDDRVVRQEDGLLDTRTPAQWAEDSPLTIPTPWTICCIHEETIFTTAATIKISSDSPKYFPFSGYFPWRHHNTFYRLGCRVSELWTQTLVLSHPTENYRQRWL